MANLKTEVTRKQSTPNFRKNKHVLPPNTHMYVCISESKKCSFFEEFGVLCFLPTSVLRFAFLPYYQRSKAYKIAEALVAAIKTLH